MTNTRKIDPEFFNIISEILENDDVKKLGTIKHHGKSILNHSLKVALYSFNIGKRLKLDMHSLTRGAILHDFFLYDWNNSSEMPKRKFYEFYKMHGFVHAKIALDNARACFDLNKIECNIIIRHMFPLTIIPPRYPESWVVMLVDKWVATKEIPQYIKNRMRKKTHKN
ncbi:MAG: phosphohydrolase [Spirochaetales bacterium]|nr:phosphohydrolase [Spirochaetales bacterium]